MAALFLTSQRSASSPVVLSSILASFPASKKRKFRGTHERSILLAPSFRPSGAAGKVVWVFKFEDWPWNQVLRILIGGADIGADVSADISADVSADAVLRAPWPDLQFVTVYVGQCTAANNSNYHQPLRDLTPAQRSWGRTRDLLKKQKNKTKKQHWKTCVQEHLLRSAHVERQPLLKSRVQRALKLEKNLPPEATAPQVKWGEKKNKSKLSAVRVHSVIHGVF